MVFELLLLVMLAYMLMVWHTCLAARRLGAPQSRARRQEYLGRRVGTDTEGIWQSFFTHSGCDATAGHAVLAEVGQVLHVDAAVLSPDDSLEELSGLKECRRFEFCDPDLADTGRLILPLWLRQPRRRTWKSFTAEVGHWTLGDYARSRCQGGRAEDQRPWAALRRDF